MCRGDEFVERQPDINSLRLERQLTDCTNAKRACEEHSHDRCRVRQSGNASLRSSLDRPWTDPGRDGYEHVFERQVQAWVHEGDVAIGISTSGNSKNVLLALQKARELGAFTAALTGEGGGKCAGMCDVLLAVPSKATPRIQESHITIGHIFCALLEQSLA